jgi:enoyl-CoA hydratase/carnithine racemase
MLSNRRKRLIGAACALLVTGGAALAVLAPVAPTQAAAHPAAASIRETSGSQAKMIKVVDSAAPNWNQLSAVQQHILEPLAADWDKLKPTTRKKWLEISGRYASMTPAEQERLQARMGGWATLTPEQRRIARENYARANKLDTEQRALRWQQYQQLSEQQKKELAEQATPKHKRVTTMPPATLTKSKPAAPVNLAPPATQEQTAVVAPAPAPVPAPATK